MPLEPEPLVLPSLLGTGRQWPGRGGEVWPLGMETVSREKWLDPGDLSLAQELQAAPRAAKPVLSQQCREEGGETLVLTVQQRQLQVSHATSFIATEVLKTQQKNRKSLGSVDCILLVQIAVEL